MATPRKGLREIGDELCERDGETGWMRKTGIVLKPMYNFELDATGNGKMHFVTIVALSQTSTKIIFARSQRNSKFTPARVVPADV